MSRIHSKIGMGVFNTLCIVLFLLNTFAGIVAGIWLLFKGEWGAVLVGFIASLTMPYWSCIVALPSLGLVALMGKYEPKEDKIRFVTVAFINLLYQSLWITAWVVLVFVCVRGRALESEGTLIPMLVWGYSVATSPLIYMASYEQADNIASYAMVFLSEIGYILLVILTLFGVSLLYSLIGLSLLVIITPIFLVALVVSMMAPSMRTTDSLTERWPDANKFP